MNTSLKQRLLALALTTVVMVWGAAVTATYSDARKELYEVLDAHLLQAATLLVVQTSHELNEIETEYEELQHKYSPHIAFQVWEGGKTLRIHSANAPTLPFPLLP